ncbi:MAG TPA: TetR/AcrR family transcriptional regulator [Dehalococcoidia bacterium]|nr:TetR/AcrR family transcriptional regulator [Dehalococcoidia bacterium]
MRRPVRRPATDTRSRILDVAERLIQTRGYNGFSYADVAAELRVTTASLHYHFAGKAELGRALVERYTERFMVALDKIEASEPDPLARLSAYAGLYAAVLRRGRLCLCGMLAADFQTLPRQMRHAVLDFFNRNEAWLSRVLEGGRDQGVLAFEEEPAGVARAVISTLEGAMLLARPFADVSRFESAARTLLDGLKRHPEMARA